LVLFGFGLLICAIHGLGHLGEGSLVAAPASHGTDDDLMVWTTGLPAGEGLCRVDWLTTAAGIPDAHIPRLATINFTEERQTIAATIHPRVALLFFQPVPLNRADAEVLAALPGIGPALSARIIAKREELGGFHSLAQLRQVRGLGVKTLQNLQDRLTL